MIACAGQAMGGIIGGVCIGAALMGMLEHVVTKRVRCGDGEEGDGE